MGSKKQVRFDGSLPEAWSAPIDGPIRITGKIGDPRPWHTGQSKTHHGLDIVASTGTPIHAMGGGKIIEVHRWKPGDGKDGGNTIIIEHSNGIRSMYCHLSKMNVRKGELVTTGQLIGDSGSTGGKRAHNPDAAPMQPHLHVGIFINDGTGWHYTDPTPFVNPPSVDHPNEHNESAGDLGHHPPTTDLHGVPGGSVSGPSDGGASTQGQVPHGGDGGASTQGQVPHDGDGGTSTEGQVPHDGDGGASTQGQVPHDGDGGASTQGQVPHDGDGGTSTEGQIPHDGDGGTSTEGQVPHDDGVDQAALVEGYNPAELASAGSGFDALHPAHPADTDTQHPAELASAGSGFDALHPAHPADTDTQHPAELASAGSGFDALHPAHPADTDTQHPAELASAGSGFDALHPAHPADTDTQHPAELASAGSGFDALHPAHPADTDTQHPAELASAGSGFDALHPAHPAEQVQDVAHGSGGDASQPSHPDIEAPPPVGE